MVLPRGRRRKEIFWKILKEDSDFLFLFTWRGYHWLVAYLFYDQSLSFFYI